jgi:hypothetical protein
METECEAEFSTAWFISQNEPWMPVDGKLASGSQFPKKLFQEFMEFRGEFRTESAGINRHICRG